MMNLEEKRTSPGYFNDRVRKIDLILAYTQKSRGRTSEINNRNYRTKFLQKLKILGIEMETHRSLLTEPPTFFVKLHATWRFLTRTAELLKMPMPICEVAKKSHQRGCSKCFQPNPDCPISFRDSLRIPFRKNYLTYFLNHTDQDAFFSCAQRTRMVEYEVTRCRVEMKEKDRRKTLDVQEEDGKTKRWVTFSWMLHNKVFDPYMIPHDSELEREEEENNEAKENGESKKKRSKIEWLMAPFKRKDKVQPDDPKKLLNRNAKKSAANQKAKNLPKKAENGDFKTEKPKSNGARRWLDDNWVSLRSIFEMQPLDPIYAYFGSEVAYYFAFLQFYTLALLFPAILGGAAFIYGIYYAETQSYRVQAFCYNMTDSYFCRRCTTTLCDYSKFSSYCNAAYFASLFDNLASPFYSFCLSLWAVCFLEKWNQRQADLAQRWGTASKDGTADETTRVEYLFGAKGRRKNPATLKEEPYVPKSQRRQQLAISYATVAFFLTLVASVMAGIIVYRIVFSQITNIFAGTQIGKHVSPALFASVTASTLNVFAISTMSTIYPRVARKLTEMECPRTDTQFNRSYTYKVALFQFVNYYGTIFYLGFAAGYPILPPFDLSKWSKSCEPEGCMLEVTVQLIVVLTIKQILQNFTELASPLFKNFVRRMRVRSKQGDDNRAQQVERDFMLVPPPQPTAFNDYLELAIQYGFIVMFSPAFPPAPIFALLNNIFEVRLDAYKFTAEYRRPLPKNVVSIGPWLDIMSIFTKMSVVVNAALICFNGFAIDEFHYYASVRQGIEKFVENTYSVFDTNDYDRLFSSANLTNVSLIEQLDDLKFDERSNTTIERCWYFGKFYPPESDYAYNPTEYGVEVMLTKILFMIVFQNLIMILREFIDMLIPEKSKISRDRQERESFLELEVENKEQMKRAAERQKREAEKRARDGVASVGKNVAGVGKYGGTVGKSGLEENSESIEEISSDSGA